MVKTKKVFGYEGELLLRPEMNLHFENQDPSIHTVQSEIWVIGFLKIEWCLAPLKAIGKMHHNLERACFSTYIIVSKFTTKVFQRVLQISKCDLEWQNV